MKTVKHPYLTLFLSTFQLSAFTVGSGFVIVSLMRKKFVEQLHWIDEDEMLNLTAIAQSSPGAIVVNAAFLVGYRIAGGMGALVTVLGTVLPPLLVITAVSFFYDAFRSNAAISIALKGMQAGVAAIICDVVFTMGRSVFQDKRFLPPFIFAGSFLANKIWGVNIMVLLFFCGLIGVADLCRQKNIQAARKGGGER